MKKIRIIPILMMALFLFPTAEGICFASEMVGPNVQLDFYGDDAGIYFVITDPQGRRLGYDSATKRYIEEFPAAFGFSFEGKDEISEKFHR